MTYIIGAGITGQIAKRMYPDSIMIAESIGKKPIPFYFWDTPETREFFKKYFGGFTESKVTVGYLGNNYYLYNRTTNKRLDNLPCDLKKELNCIEPVQDFNFVNPDIQDSVLFVGKTKLAGNKGTYKRDDNEKIIWTGHLDKTEFINKRFGVSYEPVTYFYFESDKELFKEDFTYLLEDRFLLKGIYRLTKQCVLRTSSFVYYLEINKKIKIEDKKEYREFLRKEFDTELEKSVFFTIEKARVISEEPIKDFEGIYFIGRFAECNHDVKVEDTIKKLNEVYKL